MQARHAELIEQLSQLRGAVGGRQQGEVAVLEAELAKSGIDRIVSPSL